MKALVAAILLVVGGSAAAPVQRLPTAGPVTLLAADGPLAAAVVAGDKKTRCTRIVLWKPGSQPTTITTDLNCDPEALFDDVDGLALGGNRVLWEEVTGGNNQELIVNTAVVSKPRSVGEVSYVENGNGAAGDPGGPYTGSLFGDGPLLVFASWQHCDPVAAESGGYARQCVDGKPELYDGALHTLAGGADRVLRRGDDLLFPIWVDGGRILVHNGSTLIFLRADGTTLRTLPAGGDFQGAVFQGARLVVLRKTALDVYDIATGARTRSYRLAPLARRLVDVQGGIAVLISRGAVRLIELDTGRGATVTPRGGGEINAQLEPSGLFTSSRTGVEFEPMAKVLARFH